MVFYFVSVRFGFALWNKNGLVGYLFSGVDGKWSLVWSWWQQDWIGVGSITGIWITLGSTKYGSYTVPIQLRLVSSNQLRKEDLDKESVGIGMSSKAIKHVGMFIKESRFSAVKILINTHSLTSWMEKALHGDCYELGLKVLMWRALLWVSSKMERVNALAIVIFLFYSEYARKQKSFINTGKFKRWRSNDKIMNKLNFNDSYEFSKAGGYNNIFRTVLSLFKPNGIAQRSLPTIIL